MNTRCLKTKTKNPSLFVLHKKDYKKHSDKFPKIRNCEVRDIIAYSKIKQ